MTFRIKFFHFHDLTTLCTRISEGTFFLTGWLHSGAFVFGMLFCFMTDTTFMIRIILTYHIFVWCINSFFLCIGIGVRRITRIVFTAFIDFIPINCFSAKNRINVSVVTRECLSPEHFLVFCLTTPERIGNIA